MSKIKFGTDGWRAILDKDFIPENVKKVILAFCEVQKDSANKLVFVGYDRRRDSDKTAQLAAQILGSFGFDVRLSKSFCPTPCVSWSVKNAGGLAGIMITASHNPSNWNGIKFKESYGGAASPEYTGKIEDVIEGTDLTTRFDQIQNFEPLLEKGQIQYFDPFETYVSHLKNFLNIDKIRESNFKVVVDPLFGAGTDFVEAVLGQNITQIHGEADTNFGGLHPEPIEKNLSAMRDAIKAQGAQIGLATDGDADRIGAMDENGRYVSSHEIFSLLLRHNIEDRKLSGAIVKSVSTTSLIDKICDKLGVQLEVTPIGFKHISQKLVSQNALMGGEESGGISLREHVHERDGVLNGLLLLEMMAERGKSLAGLIDEMNQEYGEYFFRRDDYHVSAEKIEEVKARIPNAKISEARGVALKSEDRQDGVKWTFEDESWLLIRPSGTEPLLRVYGEALSKERMEAVLGFAKEYFGL